MTAYAQETNTVRGFQMCPYLQASGYHHPVSARPSSQ
jgi:hypothetical protein